MEGLSSSAGLTVVIRTFVLTKYLSSIECWVNSRSVNLIVYPMVFLKFRHLGRGS
jgi:hypothetical protein